QARSRLSKFAAGYWFACAPFFASSTDRAEHPHAAGRGSWRPMTKLRADPEAITRALGGDWYGSYGLAPGPGHSRQDRSPMITAHPTDSSDVSLHSFAGDDWKPIKDDLRRQGLVPEWRAGAPDAMTPSRPQMNGHSNGTTSKTAAERPKPLTPWAET